ncbi:MAG: hypothetical protein AAGF82_13575 [Pseudomonadota bacterium]
MDQEKIDFYYCRNRTAAWGRGTARLKCTSPVKPFTAPEEAACRAIRMERCKPYRRVAEPAPGFFSGFDVARAQQDLMAASGKACAFRQTYPSVRSGHKCRKLTFRRRGCGKAW